MTKEINPAAQNITVGQAFVDKVMREFCTEVGEVKVTAEMKRLIQGYFMGCDNALREAEKNRPDGKTPYTWTNIDINSSLAQNIMNSARLGLDMSLPNQLFAVPYFDNKKKKYSFSFMPGYKGREIVVRKYSLDTIEEVIVELVYGNDEFKALKKDAHHPSDTYEFTITNPFNRGVVVGGFAYIRFTDERKNLLVIMSKAEIDKRMNKASSKVFWGNWYDEMALKTILIKASKKITIDPQKIDDSYKMLIASEDKSSEQLLEAEIMDKANSIPVNIDTADTGGCAIAQIPQQPTVTQIPVVNTIVEEAIVATDAAVVVKPTEATGMFATSDEPGF